MDHPDCDVILFSPSFHQATLYSIPAFRLARLQSGLDVQVMGLRPGGGMMTLIAQRFDNPIAGGKAKGDFLWVLLNLGISAWKSNEFGRAKQSLRRALNDAVYALGRRPEGYYVAIVMVTRDVSAGSQRGLIQFVSGAARNAAPVGAFDRHHWRQLEPPGNRQHLIVVHNVPGRCPANLPAGSLDLATARATLARL
jgi:hypothetical protein